VDGERHGQDAGCETRHEQTASPDLLFVDSVGLISASPLRGKMVDRRYEDVMLQVQTKVREDL
jgi:hypothetical protein